MTSTGTSKGCASDSMPTTSADRACRRGGTSGRYCQSQLRLHAVEQFVEEELLAAARCKAGDKIPDVRHPHRPAPLETRVDDAEQSRASRFRCGLAGGERLRP